MIARLGWCPLKMHRQAREMFGREDWGNHRDIKVRSRLNRLFPMTMQQLCDNRKWNFRMGLQLREASANEEVVAVPDIATLKLLDPKKMTASHFHFSVPAQALEDIPANKLYVRKYRRQYRFYHNTGTPYLPEN